MSNLRWEPQPGGGEYAYSGDLVVGMIGTLSADPRTWWYSATDAVFMRHITKGNGHVRSRASARKAVERAWEKWLKAAGLVPMGSTVALAMLLSDADEFAD